MAKIGGMKLGALPTGPAQGGYGTGNASFGAGLPSRQSGVGGAGVGSPSRMAAHLFNSLVRNPARNTGRKPKVPGMKGLPGLPFHGTNMNTPPMRGNFSKPMIGGISRAGSRV